MAVISKILLRVPTVDHTCSIEHRNMLEFTRYKRTEESEYCEYTRSMGSIEQCHTSSSTRGVNEQYRTLKYYQSVLAVSPVLPSEKILLRTT